MISFPWGSTQIKQNKITPRNKRKRKTITVLLNGLDSPLENMQWAQQATDLLLLRHWLWVKNVLRPMPAKWATLALGKGLYDWWNGQRKQWSHLVRTLNQQQQQEMQLLCKWIRWVPREEKERIGTADRERIQSPSRCSLGVCRKISRRKDENLGHLVEAKAVPVKPAGQARNRVLLWGIQAAFQPANGINCSFRERQVFGFVFINSGWADGLER